ncbi:hypothetical protein [Saccharothrix australiensis]|uniref:Uncharacterized protein n=1 Tax=Saccharothrix australiensis TaxID=2072 RepID=A0A495W3C7_9PSEU|nr:hypothetical protein [Saccharothrix australiensis]RKT56221.1 hypothetical protein C8E97_4910 [Saccharothrix australiensis]
MVKGAEQAVATGEAGSAGVDAGPAEVGTGSGAAASSGAARLDPARFERARSADGGRYEPPRGQDARTLPLPARARRPEQVARPAAGPHRSPRATPLSRRPAAVFP